MNGKQLMEEMLEHSAKGTTWKKHKYIGKKNGKYVYPSKKSLATKSNVTVKGEDRKSEASIGYPAFPGRAIDELEREANIDFGFTGMSNLNSKYDDFVKEHRDLGIKRMKEADEWKRIQSSTISRTQRNKGVRFLYNLNKKLER